MEQLNIRLDNPEAYDAVLKDSLPECADLTIITKHGAMQSGKAAVMITFTVHLPDGNIKRVQAVCPMTLFRATLGVIMVKYTDEGFPVDAYNPNQPDIFDDPTIT